MYIFFICIGSGSSLVVPDGAAIVRRGTSAAPRAHGSGGGAYAAVWAVVLVHGCICVCMY